MKLFFQRILPALVALACSSAGARSYYVSPQGDDRHSGTLEKPFRTLEKAAAKVSPGDTCFIRGGVYRETLELLTSGTEKRPVVFSAYEDERVTLAGADRLPETLPWKPYKKGIWQVAADDRLHELLIRNDAMLFDGMEPMSEARWPDMMPQENWREAKKWAEFDMDRSEYGQLVCKEAGKSGLDFSGGTLHMKYVYNFFGSRKITGHEKGSDKILYEQSGAFGDPESKTAARGTGGFPPWFFISGCLGALDADGEWHYDRADRILYLKTPGNQNPKRMELAVTAREFGLLGEDISWVTLRNLHLVGCSIRLGSGPPEGERRGGIVCRNLRLEGCSVLWPTRVRAGVMNDATSGRTMGKSGEMDNAPRIVGENCTVDSCEFGYSTYAGLRMEGRGNRVVNSVIHDTALNGWMNRSGLSLVYGYKGSYSGPAPNILSRCTIYNSGGVGIYIQGPGPQSAHSNHVFNAGLYSGDISGLYIPYGAKAQGSEVAYNWIHSIRGIGLRCDAMGREVTAHHNVVWNASAGCKWEGAGGEDDIFELYNNTIFIDNDKHPFMLSETEPAGDLLDRRAALVNTWRVCNNVSYGVKYRYWFKFWREVRQAGGDTSFYFDEDESDTFTANVSLVEESPKKCFVSTDLETLDLRPKKGSPLMDQGKAVKGITDAARGRPDVGAYEYGGEYWAPGADWMTDGSTPPRTMKQAVALAWQKLGDKRVFSDDASYAHK